MKVHQLNTLLFLLIGISTFSQNKIDIKAFFDVENKQIRISQTIEYYNTSSDSLSTIYLNDWSNSFSSKTTPLALRFSEEFSNKFHFAKNEDRGFSVITSLTNQNSSELKFNRLPEHPDVLKVELINPVAPNSSYILNLNYIVQVPSDSFTRYGVTNNYDYKLKYWYITPAIYDGEWNFYSNKDLDDLFIPTATLNFELEYPRNYLLVSELNMIDLDQNKVNQIMSLYGENRVDTKLFLTRIPSFKQVETDFFTVVTNIEDEGLASVDKAIITDNIAKYLTENLGNYPHKKLLLTNAEYKKSPVYGLNQLPNFIRPFPDNFVYEIKILKSALNNYLTNTLLINPRKEQWLIDGLQTYFLMKYVEEKYPDLKLIGSLSRIWGLKSFHASDLYFNDQYPFMYMNMARSNLDQPLTMQKDSLLKFNKNLANKYKAGLGLKYLDTYINGNILENTIKEFLSNNKTKLTSYREFKSLLKQNTDKELSWFFDDYLKTNKEIDYKLKNAEILGDSIHFTIKNKTDINVPISLYTMNKDSVISKTWFTNIKDEQSFTIPKENATKLVLNGDKSIPEINLRNNSRTLTPSLLNKPIQVRLIKDVEDPRFNQVFLMPIIEYRNIYDGLRLGIKVYNKTILKKPFAYKISPEYSTKSRSITGATSLVYNHYVNNKKRLYKIKYGLGASYSSYAEDLFVSKFVPSVSFQFKDNSDFRSNKREVVNLRYVNINRDEDILNISDVTEPNYGVYNIRYINSNPGLINYSKWFADFQISQRFSKLSFNYEFRRVFQNNRQLNVRLFAGKFISNRNDPTTDYFSFALDRPTDYLFDYDYLGRSENSGIFSQQIIIAEGGFKSKLNTPYANQWLTTMNVGTSIWKYIHAYGDVGLVKNKFKSAKFVYDSGIRVNLVADYFEIFFPVYSNLGWEISQPNYSQKIRFVFTADPKTLFKLFTRRWY